MVTIREVARAAGVSVATASRALNGLRCAAGSMGSWSCLPIPTPRRSRASSRAACPRYSSARAVLRSGFECDAVFAANDLMAVEFMAAMRDAGTAIGTDLMVAGFDDIPLARYVMPQLTTVHSDIPRLGQAAAGLVLRLLADGAS